MIENKALEALKRKVLRAEIERRGALDADLIETYIAGRVTVDGRGELIAVDDAGTPRVGRGPGYANMTAGELLDEVAAERPTLFKGKAKSSDQPTMAAGDNPFAKGPSYNLTKAMALYRSDPELAEHLAAEAGFKIGGGS